MIGEATSYLSSHNITLLQTIEEVFAENMEIMKMLKDAFDVETMVTSAVKANISLQSKNQT